MRVLRFFLFISKGVLLLTAMTTILWLTAVVILSCVLFQRLSGKVGVPALLFFILLGMFFGTDGVVKIPFDNFELAQNVCSVALLFIMFYGGFGTNVRSARPVAAQAVLLSSVGTVLTAGLVGVFCHFVLGVALWESFLIGAVISSTDAASVFSVLRSRHLNLKYHTASLLEVESGSNDPFSYMLTTIVLSVMHGGSSGGQFAAMLAAQIGYGVLFGVVLALAARWVLGRFRFSAGFDAVFAVAVALLSYVLPEMLGGNGYLSVYLTGMILGNSRIPNKSGLVHFFDAATALMQMVLFFLLGLLAFPSQLPRIAPRALVIVSDLCGPPGSGGTAAYAVSCASSPAAAGELVRSAWRGVHRIRHYGNHAPGGDAKRCVSYCVLYCAVLCAASGYLFASSGGKAGHDRRRRRCNENLYRLCG